MKKNNKFFLGLEKNKAKRKHITTILKNNGKYTSDKDEILKEQVYFYTHLYSDKEISENKINKYLEKSRVTQLSKEYSTECEGLLTVDELTDTVFKMQLNKSPGSDGLSVEFYRTFWDYIKDILCNSLNFSYENKKLTNTQRTGLINLLFKKGQREKLEN